MSEEFVRTIRRAQFYECTYFNRRLRSRTYRASKRPRISSSNLPLRRASIFSFFHINRSISGSTIQGHARTPITSTFPEDLNGLHCAPVSVVVQRWHHTIQYCCIWWLLAVFHISPKPLPPGAVIRSRSFLPDARGFSSVTGGAPIFPFSSSGAVGARESACRHVSRFSTSNHPIIRRLTMGPGVNNTKAATQGTCISR